MNEESRKSAGELEAEEGRAIARQAGRDGDFFSPPPAADEDDPLDRLGTRIGRALGLGIAIAMLAGLVVYLLGRGG